MNHHSILILLYIVFFIFLLKYIKKNRIIYVIIAILTFPLLYFTQNVSSKNNINLEGFTKQKYQAKRVQGKKPLPKTVKKPVPKPVIKKPVLKPTKKPIYNSKQKNNKKPQYSSPYSRSR
jgi:outer membrane biosynthesis protein TonB